MVCETSKVDDEEDEKGSVAVWTVVVAVIAGIVISVAVTLFVVFVCAKR